jgi:glycosyltransferase involved in cell wall biosynthesis
MKSEVKISVIVPVYNVEKYLHQCIDSLIHQTLKDIEIICINDISTDRSLDILQEYAQKDDRIIVVDLKEKGKPGGARNAGIRIAQGEYIGLVDSDDWVAEDMYESLYNASQNGTVDTVITDYYTYNEFDKKKSYSENVPEHIIDSVVDVHKHIIIHGCPMWTAIVKKKLIIDNELFYPENLLYEDNAIGGALYCSSKTFAKVNTPLYYYRLNETSITHAKNDFFYYLFYFSLRRFHNVHINFECKNTHFGISL